MTDNGVPARVAKLGYVAVRTPDVARLTAYYTDAISLALTERTKSSAYLTTGPDHHCVAIDQGPSHGRTRVGLELSGSLDDAARRLADAGLSAERRSDPEPGIGEALVVAEPGGDAVVHLYERQSIIGVERDFGLRPAKLGHVASFTDDLGATQTFYERQLGFRWSDTIGDFFVFLRCGPDHHAVNFLASDNKAGLHHLAFEARDVSHLISVVDHLAQNGYPLVWGPGRHGVGHNVFTYHRDPDGNVVEVFTEIDLIFDERAGFFEPRPWHEEFPQGPRVWEPSPAAANKWGPVNPEMLER
jgi:catechol-2,3-dioxygenase